MNDAAEGCDAPASGAGRELGPAAQTRENAMGIEVSVIVPTCHRRSLLERLLGSLLQQSLSPERFEIVVVSDGPDGGTAELVKHLQEQHQNLVFIEQERQGPAVARNRACRIARGRYFAFTDDDCIVAGDWLEKLVEAFGRTGAAGIQGRTSTDRKACTPLTCQVSNEHGMSGVPTCNAAYRREIFERAGGFDESFPFPHDEDADLAWRIEKLGSICFAPEVHVFHPPRLETLRRKAHWVRFLESEFLLFAKHPETYRKRCHGSPWITIYWRVLVSAQVTGLKICVKYLFAPAKRRFFFHGAGLVLVRSCNLIRFLPFYVLAARRYGPGREAAAVAGMPSSPLRVPESMAGRIGRE